eukprot:gene8007-9852_t
MESVLPELEAISLIHSTCLTTTKHLLQQREILAHQPLILIDYEEFIDDSDDDDDECQSELIFTQKDFTTNNNNNNLQKKSLNNINNNNFKRRYSSELIFHPISTVLKSFTPTVHSSFTPLQNKTTNINDKNNSSTKISTTTNSNQCINSTATTSEESNKKRKRNNLEDDDDQDHNKENDENNFNNLESTNITIEKTIKRLTKMQKTGFITIPKAIKYTTTTTNFKSTTSSPQLQSENHHLLTISKTMNSNVFNCLIKPSQEGLLTIP